MITRLTALAVALAITCIGSSAFAGVLFSESFDYAAGSDVPVGPWVDQSVDTDTEDRGVTITDGGLSVAGLGTGNAATFKERFSRVVAPMSSGLPTAAGEVYMSYMIKMTANSNWGETIAVGLGSTSWTQGDGLFTGIYENSANLDNENIFGALVGRAADTDPEAELQSLVLQPGENAPTYFVLAKMSWDASNVYIKASVFEEALPVGEPVAWDMDVMVAKTWPFSQGSAEYDQVILNRQNVGDNAVIDEILVGTEYSDVVPEPATMALLGLGGLVMARRRRV